jgi:hypothetical protein
MCDKIIYSFIADCYCRKENLQEGMQLEFKMKIDKCICGEYWTTSFTGEKMYLVKEKTNDNNI